MPGSYCQDPVALATGLGCGLGIGINGCSGDLNVQGELRNTALNKVISTVEARLQTVEKQRVFCSGETSSLNIRHGCLVSVSFCLAVGFNLLVSYL